MKMPSQLLGKLHKLSSRDRAWIVQRLSEQERTELMSTLAASTPVEPDLRTESKSADAMKRLARIEPRLVAMIAKNEPAWLNAAIVAAQHEAWSREYLEALPSLLRADVARIQSKHFGAALTESAARLILARYQGNVPVESAFDRLVERLGTSRARKRMTLHL